MPVDKLPQSANITNFNRTITEPGKAKLREFLQQRIDTVARNAGHIGQHHLRHRDHGIGRHGSLAEQETGQPDDRRLRQLASGIRQPLFLLL